MIHQALMMMINHFNRLNQDGKSFNGFCQHSSKYPSRYIIYEDYFIKMNVNIGSAGNRQPGYHR